MLLLLLALTPSVWAVGLTPGDYYFEGTGWPLGEPSPTEPNGWWFSPNGWRTQVRISWDGGSGPESLEGSWFSTETNSGAQGGMGYWPVGFDEFWTPYVLDGKLFGFDYFYSDSPGPPGSHGPDLFSFGMSFANGYFRLNGIVGYESHEGYMDGFLDLPTDDDMSVPEPGTLSLFAGAVLLLQLIRRKRLNPSAR